MTSCFHHLCFAWKFDLLKSKGSILNRCRRIWRFTPPKRISWGIKRPWKPCTTIWPNGIIFLQPRFAWNKGMSLTKPPFGVRSCEVAIIWPELWKHPLPYDVNSNFPPEKLVKTTPNLGHRTPVQSIRSVGSGDSPVFFSRELRQWRLEPAWPRWHSWLFLGVHTWMSQEFSKWLVTGL